LPPSPPLEALRDRHIEYRRTSISGKKRSRITFPLRHFFLLKVVKYMEKSSQIAWEIVPLRRFFPLKVVPLIEVLLYGLWGEFRGHPVK
jgi:hypothetical protein